MTISEKWLKVLKRTGGVVGVSGQVIGEFVERYGEEGRRVVREWQAIRRIQGNVYEEEKRKVSRTRSAPGHRRRKS